MTPNYLNHPTVHGYRQYSSSSSSSRRATITKTTSLYASDPDRPTWPQSCGLTRSGTNNNW